MSRHSTALEIERALPADAIHDLLPPANPKPDHKPDQQDRAVSAPAARAGIKDRVRKLLMAGTAVALLAGAAWYGWDYWTVGRFLVSTDDAYVKADNTTIAPKVSGYLTDVLVGDNQRVKAGQ